MAPGRTDALIVGVNKSGTTSLFVSLSAHPDVAPSSVKETRFFLPARYGGTLPPAAEWDAYFADAGDRPVHLEATPSHFYGGAAVAEAMRMRLVDPHALVVLREPVERAISFFTYQKIRLRFPADHAITDYFTAADRLTAADFDDPDNEKYMAFRGGCYADYLPEWLDVLGVDHVRIIDFRQLVDHPLTTLHDGATWLGLDPARFPANALSTENRTTGYKSHSFQRLALASNDKLERVLRRNPALKRRLRAFYYLLNGRPAEEAIPDSVRADLDARYEEPNARLAQQLDAAGIELPSWLSPSDPSHSGSTAE